MTTAEVYGGTCPNDQRLSDNIRHPTEKEVVCVFQTENILANYPSQLQLRKCNRFVPIQFGYNKLDTKDSDCLKISPLGKFTVFCVAAELNTGMPSMFTRSTAKTIYVYSPGVQSRLCSKG